MTSVGTDRPVADSPRMFNDTDMAILEFERLHWRRTGAKQQAILDQFAMTEVRYFQVLNWILDQPGAEAYDAVLVGKLRRLRDLRAAVRTRGTTAAGVTARQDARGVRPALLGGLT